MSEQLDNLEIIELTEENIGSMVYTIRGVKVMLDFDLARIYGYETRYLNRQVKNNTDKFPNDLMFQLTIEETQQIMMCKNFTSRKNNYFLGQKGGTRKLPFAFTEQGIYMLMTVLKGELAIKQSKALIRLFKKMKDYIVESNNLINANEIIKLANKVNDNSNRLDEVEKKLDVVMDNFIDPSTYKHFLFMNGEKIEAKIAIQILYSLANHSIFIIDDYIDLKTLSLLKCVNKNANIVIFSDNVSRTPVIDEDIKEFEKEYELKLTIKPTNNAIHDRYVILDYNTPNEKLYHCGASSKDAGNKATTIVKIDDSGAYHPLIDSLIHQD